MAYKFCRPADLPIDIFWLRNDTTNTERDSWQYEQAGDEGEDKILKSEREIEHPTTRCCFLRQGWPQCVIVVTCHRLALLLAELLFKQDNLAKDACLEDDGVTTLVRFAGVVAVQW